MPNWRIRAACRTADPDLWFPDKGDHGDEAKRVCNGTDTTNPCPVREPCLDYALRHKIVHGIWGGLNYRDRYRLTPGNGRPAAALCPQGHALTADNTVRNGRDENGDQAYRCRRCHRERRIRIREAQREKAS